MAEEEIEVFVQVAGEDLLAGRLWSHRRQGRESATFTYQPEYLGHQGAYELDPALPLDAEPSRLRSAVLCSERSQIARPTAGVAG